MLEKSTLFFRFFCWYAIWTIMSQDKVILIRNLRLWLLLLMSIFEPLFVSPECQVRERGLLSAISTRSRLTTNLRAFSCLPEDQTVVSRKLDLEYEKLIEVRVTSFPNLSRNSRESHEKIASYVLAGSSIFSKKKNHWVPEMPDYHLNRVEWRDARHFYKIEDRVKETRRYHIEHAIDRKCSRNLRTLPSVAVAAHYNEMLRCSQ